MFQAQHDTEHVRVERCGVSFSGLFRKRAGLTFRASVVHRYVEAAEARNGFVDERANVIVLANVCLDEFRFGAEIAQLGREGFTLFLAPARNDEPCAFPRERDGRGTADSRQGAGDQNDWFAH
jgi:hypothetical protein